MSKLRDLRHELIANNRLELRGKNQTKLLERAFLLDNPICANCGTNKNISYDHIIPTTILTSFNIDSTYEFWEENGQSLCVGCNQKKAHFLDLSNPKTKILLKELLDK